MAGVTKEFRIHERSVRARLTPRQYPYWRTISEGCHLGYYRGTRRGTWIARYREAGSAGPAVRKSIGDADDGCEANGSTILNWKQALDAATSWFALQEAGGDGDLDPNMTVADAVIAYIEMRDARETARVGRKARSTASFKLNSHVLADQKLSGVKLCDLNEAHLRSWQRRLSCARGSSKLRVLSELKAALNDIYAEHRKALPRDFPVTVKFGCRPVFADDAASESVARSNQVLPDERIRKILAAVQDQDSDGDNSILAILLAATGARFSQVVRMFVRDVELDRNCVFVPPSRKGRGKKIGPHIRVQVGEDVVAALRSHVENRGPNEPLLLRWRYRQVSPTKWIRVSRAPWKTPSEMQRWWPKQPGFQA
ncbi:tyrosine-type recombinase/integrase [Sphingosinicella sp. LHD-64]|nr:tyrosine-type recombinase/integrase [Sphingosinicella sp. LHD-64]MDQ8756197.1 tyrosine-type recombinase/integrase [Sphingosinicella sp. LHD-64]